MHLKQENSYWGRSEKDTERVEAFSISRLQQTPRRLKRKDGAASGATWLIRIFILPHTLIGIALLLYPILYISNAVAGTDVPGSIIDKYTHSDEDGRAFKIEVAYNWEQQKNYKKFSVKRSQYESTKVGEAVDLRFLPAFRDWTIDFRAKGEPVKLPDLGTVLFYAFFAGFWNLIAGTFAFIIYIAPIINSRLLKVGCVSEGVVLKKEETSDSESSSYKITCKFTPDKPSKKASSDLKLSGMAEPLSSTSIVPKTLFDRVKEGDRVNVIYFPDKPSINTVFEYSGYELN